MGGRPEVLEGRRMATCSVLPAAILRDGRAKRAASSEADPKENSKKRVISVHLHDSLRWLRITEGHPMAWTKTTRKQYRRVGLRYASDTRANEWILLSPLLPKRARTGRPPTWTLRTITDAILYILATGCQWRALPKDFPPFTTVQHYFYDWRDRNVLASDQSCAGRAHAPGGGTQAHSFGWDHRQPECENHRKWRPMRV